MDLKDNFVDRVDRLGEIIAEVLEAEEAGRRMDRAALLSMNPELTSELEQFFAQHDKLRILSAPLRPAGSALNRRPAKADTDPALRPGDETLRPNGLPMPSVQRFGDYDLLDVLAVGGMGIVYRAQQHSLNRRVALKMIRSGVFATSAERERFRFEAEAVAALDHPNIVPVYEVGDHGGMPYFSMKLMEGGDLGDLARRERPQPRSAAQIIVSVARAVHHAHQRGILHRDLKPSNILLDADGRPHVTDFGLAKLVRVDAQPARTLSGMAVGTPSYMAPEQARGGPGSASTAADVYSLGAIFYEVLTGVPPLRGATPMETLRKVLDEEPASPRKLVPHLDADLETICLKCLEKAPERRYESALALAEDLERWQVSEPIRARPISTITRVVKWSRRRPAVAALAAGLVFVLLGSLAGLTALWLHAEGQRDLAEKRGDELATERDEVLRQSNLAQENFDLAFRSIEDVSGKLASRQLIDAPKMEQLRSDALRAALKYYDQFLAKRASDTTIAGAVAQAYFRHAKLSEELLSSTDAERSFLRARDMFEQLMNAEPGVPSHQQVLADACAGLGRSAITKGRTADAIKHLQRAVALTADLRTRFPEQRDYDRSQITHMLNLGVTQERHRGFPEALPSYEQAEQLARTLAAKDGDDPENQRLFAIALHTRGVALSRLRRFAEVLPWLEESRDVWDRLAERKQSPPDARYRIAALLGSLGYAYSRSSQRDEALPMFRQALQLAEEHHRLQPGSLEAHVLLAMSNGNVAWWHRQGRQPKEALPFEDKRRSILASLVQADPKNARVRVELAQAWYDLGLTQEAAGGKDEALTAYEECAKETERVLQEDSSAPVRHRMANSLWHAGTLLEARGEQSEAITRYEKSATLHRKLLDEESKNTAYHSDLAQTLGCLCDLAERGGNRESALALVAEAVQHDLAAFQLAPQNTRYTSLLSRRLSNLGLQQRRLGKHADAAATARKRLECWPQDPEQRFQCARELAACMKPAAAEDPQVAERYAVEAIQTLEQAIAAGFRDRAKIDKAPEFKALQDRPEFQELLKRIANP